MFQYPIQINNRIAQGVAAITFTVVYTIIIRPDFDWLIFPLTLDFILRYFHPKISPLAQIIGFIDKSILKSTPTMYYAPPKRFAVLIGIFFTIVISISSYFHIIILKNLFLILILLASSLQAFFNYCIGCKIYDLIIKTGIFGNYDKISLSY